MLYGPDDVYDAIEKDKLGMKLYLSSTYQCTEMWTKKSLEFKILMTFLVDCVISVVDIHDRLRALAEKEVNKQFANEDDIPIYVYLTALQGWNHGAYMSGCEIVSQVDNLHWARQHVLAWAKEQEGITEE